MLFRRLLYLAALVAALVFQIANDNYLAHFLLALCVSLPLLSLALSLPGMIGCRLTLAASPAELPRGEQGQWLLLIHAPLGLPLSRLSLRLTERNLFTGAEKRQKLSLTGVSGGEPITRPADAAHCGLLELRAEKVRVLDYLGLFALRRPAPEPARLLVCPIPAESRPIHIPDGVGVRPSPNSATRRGPGDDCDLRDYRPGDPLRSVHWKLSSKWDELIVRERAETLTPLPLLTFDRSGKPEELDRVLDKLEGRCRSLLTTQRAHGVLWLDEKGEAVLRPVSDEKELRDCLMAILSTPLPPKRASLANRPELLDLAGEPIFRLHVTAGEEDNYG